MGERAFPQYRQMTVRSILIAVLFSLPAFLGNQCLSASAQQSDSSTDFRQLLQEMADYSPDPCGPPYGEEKDWHSADVEMRLFDKAATFVTQELSAGIAGAGSPRDRAAEALKRLERMSAEINSAWPGEHRFHFEILDLLPALGVKMTIRTHATVFVLGVPQEDSGSRNWHDLGSGGDEYNAPQSFMDLRPLHRGPSGNPRLLAKIIYSGCAGSLGVEYDAWEWSPKSPYFDQIIELKGSFGLDDKVPGFKQIGEFKTEGLLITLPYCWFSSIDTWDNPSLCAVDTFDVSGDDIRFRSRAYNRPDLLPIAKAIEYAEQRDYPAVLGYCGSADVARRMVRDIPPHAHAEALLSVNRTGQGKEQVQVGGYRFDVEKRAGRWLVVAFRAQ